MEIVRHNCIHLTFELLVTAVDRNILSDSIRRSLLHQKEPEQIAHYRSQTALTIDRHNFQLSIEEFSGQVTVVHSSYLNYEWVVVVVQNCTHLHLIVVELELVVDRNYYHHQQIEVLESERLVLAVGRNLRCFRFDSHPSMECEVGLFIEGKKVIYNHNQKMKKLLAVLIDRIRQSRSSLFVSSSRLTFILVFRSDSFCPIWA